MADLEFRFATPADAPAVVAVVNAAYRGTDPRAWTGEAHLVTGPRVTEDGVLEVLAREDAVLLLAVRDARVVGSVQVSRADAADECVLGMLSVDPGEQAGGVGRALVAEAERVARERFGARVMSMRVITVREDVLAWYERRGYRRTGVVTRFEPPERVTLPRGPVWFERLVKELGSDGA